MNVFQKLLLYRKRWAIFNSVDSEVRQLYRSKLNFECPNVRKRITNDNLSPDGEYDERTNTIALQKDLIDGILEKLPEHPEVRGALVQVLTHEYFHAIKHRIKPYNQDFIMLNYGISAQVGEIAATFVAATICNLNKEVIINQLRSLVKTRYPDYSSGDALSNMVDAFRIYN